jgi:hypothetical protein
VISGTTLIDSSAILSGNNPTLATAPEAMLAENATGFARIYNDFIDPGLTLTLTPSTLR